MKILLALIVALAYNQSLAAGYKTVCINKTKGGHAVIDKTGKPVQDCRKVKMHKRLQGTKVPAKRNK